MFKVSASEFGTVSSADEVFDMTTEDVVHGVYKVVTWSCFGIIQQHKVSGGKWRSSLGDTHLYYSRSTAILLLYMVTHKVQSVAMCVILYAYTIPRKIEGIITGSYTVKLLTAGYIVCRVNGV